MNTVMDDNKMLTLASNERIPLTPSMRLLLEINHMNHCSPATVSRGGVIFVNAEDVGWKPVVDSWIEKLEVCASGWRRHTMLSPCCNQAAGACASKPEHSDTASLTTTSFLLAANSAGRRVPPVTDASVCALCGSHARVLPPQLQDGGAPASCQPGKPAKLFCTACRLRQGGLGKRGWTARAARACQYCTCTVIRQLAQLL